MSAWHPARMRVADQQLQQALVVSQMQRASSPGALHDARGLDLCFRTVRLLEPAAVLQPHSCRMTRPD